jgi:monofunctional glycosyltransferase
MAHNQVEQSIEDSEDLLSRTDRIARLFHIKEAVIEALDKKVDKDDQVKGEAISNFAKEALVATEDKRFYEHGAMDPKAIVRATYTNLIAGQTVEGGSTITQQLVKNLFLSSKRVMSRKVEEALIAIQVERKFSKDQILTMYMNSIYYGNDYMGIKAAARGYFDTTPGRLSLAQSAMLAGLPQAPNYYNPVKNYSAAKGRQKLVLQLMVDQGMISKAQMEEAYREDLVIMGVRRSVDQVDEDEVNSTQRMSIDRQSVSSKGSSSQKSNRGGTI